MSRMTNDLSAVRMLFGPGILNVVNTAMVYATGLWLLIHLSPRLTLIAVAPYPILIARGALLEPAHLRGQPRAAGSDGDLSTTLQEDLAGIAVVKSYALEERRAAAFAAPEPALPGAGAVAGAHARQPHAAVRGHRRASAP